MSAVLLSPFSLQTPLSQLSARLTAVQSSEEAVTQFFGSSAGLGVTYGNDKWVAVGNGPQGSTAYSTDGVEWLPGTNFFIAAYSVAYNPTSQMFVAVGYGPSGSIAYSMDGKEWHAAATNFFEGGEGRGVAYGNGVWVAVGYGWNGTIATSTDGMSWLPSTNFFGIGSGRGVAYSPVLNQWIAVGGGKNGNICYSNNNALTFTVSEPFFGDGEGWGVAWGGPTDSGMWMVVGNNSIGNQSIAKSLNGVTWEAVDNFFLAGTGKSIAYNVVDNLWVAVGFGYRGTIGYSTDGGQVWQSANTLFDGGAGGMCVATSGEVGTNRNSWIAVGGASPQTVTIGISRNGKLFTTVVGQASAGIPVKYLPLLPLFRGTDFEF